MGLAPGTRIAHYEIRRAIGAGGMGEVYLARDSQLGRDVALKILPETFAADADRLARFQREAMTLAAVNHRNIAQIYGVEQSARPRALIMEFVEGEDLAQRLARRAMSMDDTLPIARQIAEALAAAHQAGIVHRDLKPANIKVRPDGEVKLLDFGLAKSAGIAPPEEANPNVDAFASTITLPAGTHAGVILGTAAYMSPEQARGEGVDRRADIWAFGCVVFEMLTGRRTFSGDTVTDVLAAVLTREPDWKALPDHTPDSIRRLLRRCLEKDRKRRLHDIADARLELDDAMVAHPARIESRRRQRWVVAVGAVLLASLVIVVARKLTVPDPIRPIVQAQRLTDMVGLEETPALAPDGRSLAFTADVNGKRQVMVQLLAGGPPLQITRNDLDHQFPRWTPGSSTLIFFSPVTPGDSQGALWEIPALGGAPRRVVDSMGAGDVRSTDSRLAFFRLTGGAIELVTAPLDGSSINVVARFEPTLNYRYPRWSPDGKSIAYQAGQTLQWEIFVAAADGGTPRQLTREARQISGLAWLPNSTGIVYSSTLGESMLYLPTTRLWQVALADGAVRQVTSGEASYVHPDITKDGAIVVGRVDLASDIWKFPTDGSPQLNVQQAVRITHQTGQVVTPTASPDDREVAFVSDRGGHANLWVIDVESGDLRQITYERDPNVTVGVPVWSPRGDPIAFVSSRGGSGATPLGIWLVNRDGSNLRNLVNPGVSPMWSRDGRTIYYSGHTPGSILKIAVDGGTPLTVRTDKVRNSIGTYGRTYYLVKERELVDGLPELDIRAATPEDGPDRILARVSPARVPTWQVLNPTLSPDGKWIAQALTDGFSTNIWALSISTGEWRQITDFGARPTFIARKVSWSSDGRSVLAAVAEGDADIVLLDGLLNTGQD